MESQGGQTNGLRVAVVDDDPSVVDALRTIFMMEGFVVLTYGSGDEFLAAEERFPDCLLLDVRMPGPSGLEVLTAIGGRSYPAPVLMISGYGDVPQAVEAIKSGAQDFIAKPLATDHIVERVRDSIQAFRESSAKASRRFRGSEELTCREHEVLDQLAMGQSNKMVGRTLCISPRTVEVHRARIMEKVGARNTADLMRIVLCPGGAF